MRSVEGWTVSMQFFQHTKSFIAQLAFAPDGNTLAAVAHECKTIGLCDMANGTFRAWKPGVESWIRAIAYSPKGDILAVGDDEGSVLWHKLPADESELDFKLPAGESELDLDTRAVFALVFAPDRLKNPVSAIASLGIILLHEDQRQNEIGEPEAVYSRLAWSPRGDKIAAYEPNYDQVTLWRLNRSLEPNLAITQYSLPSECTSLAFSPDNHWLAMAHRKGVVLEDVRKRHSGPYQVLQGHLGPVTQLVFHPDGNRIATSSEDGTVRFWDFATRRETDCYRWDIGKVRAVAFSPDGMRCAAGGEKGRIVVWDVG
jgi:WD40 repeat protein